MLFNQMRRKTRQRVIWNPRNSDSDSKGKWIEEIEVWLYSHLKNTNGPIRSKKDRGIWKGAKKCQKQVFPKNTRKTQNSYKKVLVQIWNLQFKIQCEISVDQVISWQILRISWRQKMFLHSIRRRKRVQKFQFGKVKLKPNLKHNQSINLTKVYLDFDQ